MKLLLKLYHLIDSQNRRIVLFVAVTAVAVAISQLQSFALYAPIVILATLGSVATLAVVHRRVNHNCPYCHPSAGHSEES
jgi:hypothetical protein